MKAFLEIMFSRRDRQDRNKSPGGYLYSHRGYLYTWGALGGGGPVAPGGATGGTRGKNKGLFRD